MNQFTGPGAPFRDPVVNSSIGFFYLFSVTLQAGESRKVAQLMDRDADFVWTAVQLISGASCSVRFKDHTGRYFSNAELDAALLSPIGFNGPFLGLPIWPEAVIPAAGSIEMDVTNRSAGPAVLSMLFRGAKRFAVGR